MNTTMTISLRAFHVTAQDHQTGKAARRTVSIDLGDLWNRERPLTRWR